MGLLAELLARHPEAAEFFGEMLTGSPRATCRYLVAGGWRESRAGQTLAVRSPIDDSELGRVQALSAEEAAEAVEDSARAWRGWNEETLSKRADLLHRAADLLARHEPLFCELLTLEIGKTGKDARAEVTRTADLIHYFAEEGRRYYGEIIWGDSFPGYPREKLCLVWREPRGVILAIAPFNYPLNLSASKIAPALITGNAVVYKPPEQGSLSAALMAEVFRRAGTPPGVLNLVTGNGPEIGDALTTHPKVDMIAFTGSTRVGRHIGKVAGMVPMLMELGGKDAAVVFDDADLALATSAIVKGAFGYGGQRCTGVKRVVCVGGVADELVARVTEKAARLVVGDPRDPKTDYGPVISDRSAEYIQSLVDDALAKGATLTTGNRRDGRYIQPTVLDRVTAEMRVAWEEPFGPVLPFLRAPDLAATVEICNRSAHGLQSCVFTRDIDRALYVARALEVGTVNVNGEDSRGPDHFPFMAVKDSGLGTQGVHYSISAMVRDRAITLNLRNPGA